MWIIDSLRGSAYLSSGEIYSRGVLLGVRWKELG